MTPPGPVKDSFQDYGPPPDLLKNRIILVTGAGAGIGRAAAMAFAQHGASVVLLGRTVTKLESAYDEIVAADYPQPAIAPINALPVTERAFPHTSSISIVGIATVLPSTSVSIRVSPRAPAKVPSKLVSDDIVPTKRC